MSRLSTVGAKVEMAFGGTPVGSPPLNPFLWTDISSDVESVQISRGRNSSLTHFDSGTATIQLDNSAAAYDPLNSAGAHYGDLLPLVPTRISMLDSTSTRQYLFWGFVQPRGGWEINYNMPHASTVTVHCVDWLTILANHKLRSTFSVEFFDPTWTTAGGRVSPAKTITAPIPAFATVRAGTFLDDLGVFSVWPVPESWSFDAGQTLMQGFVGTGSDALSYMQTVTESEGGALYVLRDGTLRFDGRLAPLTVTRQTTSQVTFGDSGTDVRYGDLQFDFAADIYNRATVTPAAITSTQLGAQVYNDTTSQQSFLISEQSLDGLLMDSIPEAKARAEQLVLQYKDPVETPKSLLLYPLRANSVRDAAIKRELRDRITIKFKPAGLGAQRTTDAYVESISHSFDANQQMTTVLGLSSISRYAFTDPSAYIKLDGTTAVDGTFKWSV